MRSPFAKPGRVLLNKMERCEKLAERPSPKKPSTRVGSPTRPPPACVKAITFSSCEDLSSLNKENQEGNQEDSLSCSLLSPGEAEGPGEPEGPGPLGLQEDSGYASPQAERSTPGGSGAPGGASPAEPRLPVLLFQRAVCRELSRAYGKTRSLDLGLVHSLAGQFGLHNVIGGKMGLEHVDVLEELLRRDMKHILGRVLLLLDDTDLLSCRKVSRAWRKVISGDPRAQRRCRVAEQRLRDSRPVGTPLTRDFTPCRVVFGHIQHLASTPINSPSDPALPVHTPSCSAPCSAPKTSCPAPGSAPKSRIDEFQQVARTLKRDEALQPCRLCGSPARLDRVVHRAVCTRQSCAFVCCTLCHTHYHGSAPCRRSTRTSAQSGPVVGSAQSKRNIRRL